MGEQDVGGDEGVEGVLVEVVLAFEVFDVATVRAGVLPSQVVVVGGCVGGVDAVDDRARGGRADVFKAGVLKIG